MSGTRRSIRRSSSSACSPRVAPRVAQRRSRIARQPPKPSAPPALKLPPVQKHKLSNGLAVWIVEQHEVPMAQLNLIVRRAAARIQRASTASPA